MSYEKFSFVLSIVLVGCATPPATVHEYPAVQENQASIVIYRPNGFVNAAAYPNVYVDGEKVGSLFNAGHLIFNVAPGNKAITLSNIWFWSGKQEWKTDIKKAERRYFRVTSDFNGALFARPMLTVSKTIAIQEVTETEAIPELARTTRGK